MPYSRSENELVSAVMSGRLLTTGPSDTLVDAAHRMADRRVGAILVVEDDRLVGILTERDVLRAAGRGTIEGTVSEWMTADPDTVAPVKEDVVHDFPANGWRMRELAEGIHFTVVNGEVLMEKGTHTGSHPGRVLHFMCAIHPWMQGRIVVQ